MDTLQLFIVGHANVGCPVEHSGAFWCILWHTENTELFEKRLIGQLITISSVEDVFDQGGWPAECFARSAKLWVKPALAREVRGHASPENFRKTDALRSILVQSESFCSTLRMIVYVAFSGVYPHEIV